MRCNGQRERHFLVWQVPNAQLTAAGKKPEAHRTDQAQTCRGLQTRTCPGMPILVVYRPSASSLRANAALVPLDTLRNAAQLTHTFGEKYHENQIEEAYLFRR